MPCWCDFKKSLLEAPAGEAAFRKLQAQGCLCGALSELLPLSLLRGASGSSRAKPELLATTPATEILKRFLQANRGIAVPS